MNMRSSTLALAALLAFAAPPCAAAAAAAAAAASVGQLPAGNSSNTEVGAEFVVSAVAFGEGEAGGAALAALVCAALAARGVRARAAPPPAACAPPDPPDARACLDAALAALARGALHAVLAPAPRAPAPPFLHDAGLEDLGDAAPPARRACVAPPPARSLLDMADARLAALYHVPRTAIDAALRGSGLDAELRYMCGNTSSAELSARECDEEEPARATLLTSDEGEAAIMHAVVAEHGLHAHVAVVRAGAAHLLAALAPRTTLVCGRGLRAERGRAAVLGPPPCARADCPFEARRLIKLVNAREMARAPSAIRALTRLALDEPGLAALEAHARMLGPAAAARAALAALPGAVRMPEVRVAVMIPASSRREAYDAGALRAAAELAEEDEARAAEGRGFEFKAELLDDACSGSRAFEYLTGALGSEFGSLSAVAGPACGAAWGDVARASAALALPVLAYTAQAPGAGAALLAAGDARAPAAAWAALLAQMGWRRLALLSELGTRAALQPAQLAAEVVAHVELPVAFDLALIDQWAVRARGAGARILLVSVEDGRAVRAALCAGRRAGLAPGAGVVWLLPALGARALRVGAGDAHNCSQADLDDAADGHLSLAPRWAASWERAPAAGWAMSWRARCERGGARCPAPPPHAALLYDALRLWAAALARLLAARPDLADDLHREDVARSLVEDAGRVAYVGVTGAFEWEAAGAGGARARASALELRQWRAGAPAAVGEWRRGALRLSSSLRWRTPDGATPHDGGERCALRALADALHADCGAAVATAGVLALAALAAPLALAAWRCRRRAEREYRARLAALGLRELPPRADAARWEVPRARVVINRKLGTGAFGTVYGGHALLGGRGWTAVAVKTLKAGASTEEKLDFLSEAEAMKRFEHENVVRLLGVITETEPVCTVMEFLLYGDLKHYLLARRHLAGAGGAAGAEVAPARLTAMARDVARALSYLARLRYVHRDVAARNCLVSAHRTVKLADFGMTRLVFEHDYYRFSRKGMLPVRWMAPESLALGVFSPASDVWSFGVLLYEIVTFGSLPFQGLSNAEVLARVKGGRTLDLPPGLKPPLVALITACWQQERAQRPAAAALAAALADAPRLLAPCLDAPLDALPLALEPAAARDAQARWVSWAAPTSVATDSTYLSADAARETDAFLPAGAPPAPTDGDR